MSRYSKIYDYVDQCFWCKQALYDAREASGATEQDLATDDGDFGCDAHPMTNMEDGCWSHETKEEVRAVVREHYTQLIGGA